MFVVDTNLLIYAVNRRSAYHGPARSALEKWRSASEAWFLTWSIIYEFLRATTHARTLENPMNFAESWSFIESLRLSPSFRILVETDRHAEVVRDLAREYPRVSGNRVHDLHIAALMREHGVAEIRTADIGFHQFKFLRVVNPL